MIGWSDYRTYGHRHNNDEFQIFQSNKAQEVRHITSDCENIIKIVNLLVPCIEIRYNNFREAGHCKKMSQFCHSIFIFFLFQFKLDQIVVWSLQPSLYNWLNIKFIWNKWTDYDVWNSIEPFLNFEQDHFLQIHVFDTKTVFIWHCSGYYGNIPYNYVPLYVRISIYMGFLWYRNSWFVDFNYLQE